MSDLVQETSEESFPASDPPAWNPLHIGPPTQTTNVKSGSGTVECTFCGRPTTLLIGGRPICDECYVKAGSCCLDFGSDDL